MTHFDKALEATRKGYVAAREIASLSETVGIFLKRGSRDQADSQVIRLQARLRDLRLIVADLEAHLRLSDAAEEHALSK